MIGSVSSNAYSPPLRDMGATSGTSAATSGDQTAKSSSSGRLFTTVEDDRAGDEATNGLQEFVDTLSDGTLGSLLGLQEADQSTTSGASGSAETGAEALFGAIDQDADGSISEDEFSNFVENGKPPPPPPMGEATGGASDTSETSGATDVFAAIDSDGDGSISQGELSSFLDQTIAGATTGDDGSTTSGTSGTSESASKTFDTMDTNKDGTVSEAELAAYLGSHAPDGPPPAAPSDAGSTSTSTVTAAGSTDTDQSTGSSDMSSRQMAAALARFAAQAYGDASAANDQLAGGGAIASQIA